MGYNYCRGCGNNCASPGSGQIHDPAAPWWMVWRTIPCPKCGGDGYAKPPGWPDEAMMRKLRPRLPPPPPPPPKRYARSAFTLVEVLVVVGLIVLLTVLAVGALKTNDAEKIRSACRNVQSAMLGARDRALHAKQPRGIRITRDPTDANIGTGFVYLQPIDPLMYTQIGVEQLDLVGGDGYPETVRVHGYNSPDWQYLVQQGFFSTPPQLRYPAGSGQWKEWTNLQQVSPTEWTVDTFIPQPSATGFVINPSDPNATVEFRMYNEILPNHQPISLPSGIVIDLARSSPNARGDLMFSPRGGLAGAHSAQGNIYLLLRDIRDVTEGIDPANVNIPQRDMSVVVVFPVTGHVATFPVDPTDADANGVADDLFRFAKAGSPAGG